MNNKLLLAILIVLFVLGLTFFIRMNSQDYQSDTNVEGSDNLPGQTGQTNSPDSSSGSLTGNAVQTGISTQDLAKHNSQSDCWVVYNGKIYDITSYLPRHPGTAGRIAPYCGTTDFQQAFTRQHGTSKVSLLMKVGTFIGDFDVVGNLASPSNSQTQNQDLAANPNYNSNINGENEYEDDEDSEEDEEEIEDDD